MQVINPKTREVKTVPNGSILRCYPDGSPYWKTPDGEEFPFDLEELLGKRKKDKWELENESATKE